MLEGLAKLNASNLEAEKSKKVEETPKKYESDIHITKKENFTLIGDESETEKQQVVALKSRDERTYRKKLGNGIFIWIEPGWCEIVATELTKKWDEWFEIRSNPYLTIITKYGKTQDLE